MRNSALPYWLSFLVVIAGLYGAWCAWRYTEQSASAGPAYSSTLASPAVRPPVTHFTLTTQEGKPFDSKSMQGQVYVVSFFFTSCPSICFRLNQSLAALQERLGDDGVKFISITVDPKTDTPEVMTKYAARFGADPKRWIFLTGDLKEIERVGKDIFKLSVSEQAHSDRAVIIDRHGRYAAQFRVLEEGQLDRLERSLQTVIDEPAPNAQAGKSDSQTADARQ